MDQPKVQVNTLKKDQRFEFEGKEFYVHADWIPKKHKDFVLCNPVIPEGKNGKTGYRVGIFTMFTLIVLGSTSSVSALVAEK
jgi:hypothetical protein